jgi:hypothetical protein
MHKVARKTAVTVIGVSEARDVPLHDLADAFERVNLVDIDEPSLHVAMNALHQNDPTGALAAKVRCFVQDITGGRFAALAVEAFGRITTSQDPERALSAVKETCEGYDAGIPNEFTRRLKASYVISSGVATQLVPMLLAGIGDAMRQRFPRFPLQPETHPTLAPAVAGLRQKLLSQHAATLAEAVEEDSLVCWWDTVAQVPSWSRMTEPEMVALADTVCDLARSSGIPALTGTQWEVVAQHGQDPRKVLSTLAQLIRDNVLPVQEVTTFIDALAQRADALGAVRAVFVPSGLAAHAQGVFVPDGPLRSWPWILNPTELSRLQVEAVLLKKP